MKLSEGGGLCEGLRKETDVRAQLEVVIIADRVAAQDLEVPALRGDARRERDFRHVLLLTLVEDIELVLGQEQRTVQRTADPAPVVGEEHPAAAVAGQECAKGRQLRSEEHTSELQ